MADDDEIVDDAADDTITSAPDNIVTRSASDDKSIVDTIIEFVTKWGMIIGAVIVVLIALLWFVRRGSDDDDDDRPWETLDSDELAEGSISATSIIRAPVVEDAFVVVEQESGEHPILEDTVEAPATDFTAGDGDGDRSGSFGSFEDTFSSETAVNLDQTDAIAEADFHMAYGLYDQAADLINGALETDPSDKSLMSKLCEIYFVWGNRDAFVDAATRLKLTVGDAENADWDKIVIMGQQIAADHDMFAGADVGAATRAVDLSFDEGGEAATALDMDFGAEDGSGADDRRHQGVDFNFDEPEDTQAGDTQAVDFDLDATGETPSIEEQFAGFGDGTSDLPSLDEESLAQAISDSGQDAGATAEIDLDDLDLDLDVDLDGLAETELASLDDIDAAGQNEALSDTGINEALDDLDFSDVSGSNPPVDIDTTGVREGSDPDPTVLIEGLDLSDLEDSGMRLAVDETGQYPMMSAESEQEQTDIVIDDSLLDATGLTQVLSDDIAVDPAANLTGQLSDADATMLAPGLGDDTIESLPDDDNFDFAKMEALPPEAFTSNTDVDETAETPAIAGTDVDLDLDDLTAALQVSEVGDTIGQARDDATVEQPRPTMPDATAEVPTMAFAPEEMSSDLHEARTMTEVGTKLDLARAYVDMGDPAGARSILEEVLDEGDDGQKQQAQQLLDSLPS